MNELNNTLMSTAIGAEVTGYVLADVRGVNSMGECAEDTSKGVELHFAPNADSAPAVVVCIMPDVDDSNMPVLSIHCRPYDTHKTTESGRLGSQKQGMGGRTGKADSGTLRRP